MNPLFILLTILCTAFIGIVFPFILKWIVGVVIIAIIYLWYKYRKYTFVPQSDTYKELEKIKKKRAKVDSNKHKQINDQVAYISKVWGYTKEQEKIIEKFIESRAYSEMYNKLTASLFPQMITLIDYCNERGQKGCKREVAKRLRELTTLMKEELKKKKILKSESYETTLEVYDQIIKAR